MKSRNRANKIGKYPEYLKILPSDWELYQYRRDRSIDDIYVRIRQSVPYSPHILDYVTLDDLYQDIQLKLLGSNNLSRTVNSVMVTHRRYADRMKYGKPYNPKAKHLPRIRYVAGDDPLLLTEPDRQPYNIPGRAPPIKPLIDVSPIKARYNRLIWGPYPEDIEFFSFIEHYLRRQNQHYTISNNKLYPTMICPLCGSANTIIIRPHNDGKRFPPWQSSCLWKDKLEYKNQSCWGRINGTKSDIFLFMAIVDYVNR